MARLSGAVHLFDSGFLLSLAVDQTYANAVREHWMGGELWVPRSVHDELRHQNAHPRQDIPPELPNKALGIIMSHAWTFNVIDLTAPEAALARP